MIGKIYPDVLGAGKKDENLFEMKRQGLMEKIRKIRKINDLPMYRGDKKRGVSS